MSARHQCQPDAIRVLFTDYSQSGNEEAGEAARVLESQRGPGFTHHHEAFFNGSLILATDDDRAREKQRYRRLLDRTTVSWINNCGTSGDMVGSFIATVMK